MADKAKSPAKRRLNPRIGGKWEDEKPFVILRPLPKKTDEEE